MKPMETRVIFESEEECKKFLQSFYCACSDRNIGIESTFDNIKRAGLSGKNPVEEAEEAYRIYKDKSQPVGLEWVIEKLYQSQSHQKLEIERLNKLLSNAGRID